MNNDFPADWNAFETQIESLVARAANDGWAIRRGDMIDAKSGTCCLLGAIVIAKSMHREQGVRRYPCFEDAVEFVGCEAVASALEGGFEGWEYLEHRAPRAFETGRRICRRYGADPLYPHAADLP